MAFPLDIRTELHLAGAWTDISPDVYVRDQKVISRGRRDQGAATDPSSLSLTLNNRGGKYAPRNAMSPLYGLIGRNTRVRVSVPGLSSSYLQMEADGAQTVSTPDAAPLDITGDLDVRAELSANWYGPDNQTVIGKWDAATNQRSYLLRIENGALYFHVSGDGGAANAWWFGRTLPRLPQRAALRATYRAASRTMELFWAESLAGPWTSIRGPYVLGATAPTVLFNSSAPLAVGLVDASANPKFPRMPFSGRGYRFEVRSGIDGTIVAAPDFTALAPGTKAFTDSAGRPWTLAGGTEVRDREDRFLGEISSWPTEWSLDGSDVWTPIQASGILRRLGQGQKPLDSTLRRRIPSGNPVAYWPMEDDGTTTRAYSPLPGVEPASVTGLEFASASDLVSSAPLPKLTADASLAAPIPSTMPSGAYQVEFLYNADDKPPTDDYPEVMSFSSPNGTVRRWSLALKKGVAWIRGYGSGTDYVVNQAVGIGDDVFHGWVRFRLWVRDSETTPGTVEWRANWQDVGGDAGGYGSSYTGTAGRLSYLTAKWGPLTEGWGIGHLMVLATASDTLLNGSDDAFHGETAWERLRRLAYEEKIPLARIPGELEPERVGYQRQDTILNLLDDAATADGGMLLEDPRRVGLVYRDRSSLYTQEPKLVLSYTAPGLGPELKPVDDDSSVRNDITVTRDGGTSGRAFLEDGPLSIQPPPYGIGKYDEAVTLSLAHDTQPEPVANWRLHLGTHDGARYPTVSVTFHKPGAEVHIPAALGLHEGDLIRLTDLPPWVAHGDVDLIVEGWTETLDLYTWSIDFNCSPGGPWNLAVVEHPTYAKVDTDGSTLGAPIGASDTALVVRSDPGPQWTADPQDAPIPVQFGGEVARVDAVGQLLSANPWLDSGLSGWVGQATGAVALDTNVVHPQGGASARVTPTGTGGSNSFAMSTRAPGTAGLSYTGCYWVYSPAGWVDFRVSFDWYNASGTLISTTSQPAQSVPAGQWTFLTFTATAPALTTSIVARVRQGTTPPASSVYHVWGLRLLGPGSGAALSDTFSRTNSGGWGSADTGQTWSTTGGAAADYAVNGTVGQHVMNTRNILRYTYTPASSADVDVRTDWAMDKTAVTDSNYVFLMARYTDTTHLYFARVQVSGTGQAMTLTIRKRNGAEVQVGGSVGLGTYTPGTFYTLRLQVTGSTLQAKCWQRGTLEPDAWQITTTDTDLTAVGSVGCRSLVGSTSTQTLPVTASFDNFQILDAQTFTVTRSVNGVVKPHAAGTPVSLAFPAVASL